MIRKFNTSPVTTHEEFISSQIIQFPKRTIY